MPTRKWLAGVVTATSVDVINIITSGWTQATQIAVVSTVTAAVVGYLLPNAPASS